MNSVYHICSDCQDAILHMGALAVVAEDCQALIAEATWPAMGAKRLCREDEGAGFTKGKQVFHRFSIITC